MERSDEPDLTRVVDVLRAMRAESPNCPEVLVKEVQARTALPMLRLVALTRRYEAALAKSMGVGRVRYEPGRYVKYIGPTPARILFEPTAGRPLGMIL